MKTTLVINDIAIEKFPISKQDIEYYKGFDEQTNENETFDLILESMQQVGRFTFKMDEIDKVNQLVSIFENYSSDFNYEQSDHLIAYCNNKNPQSMDEMLTTATYIEDIIWVRIYDKKELGQFLVEDMEVYIDEITDEMLPFLDFEKVADKWLGENSNCSFNENGYFENTISEGTQVKTNTEKFYRFENSFFIAEIERDGMTTTLNLPFTIEELNERLQEINTDNLQEISIKNVECRYHNFDEIMDYKKLDIPSLYKTADIMESVSTKDYMKIYSFTDYLLAVNNEKELVQLKASSAFLSYLKENLNQFECYFDKDMTEIIEDVFRKRHPETYDTLGKYINYYSMSRDDFFQLNPKVFIDDVFLFQDKNFTAESRKVLVDTMFADQGLENIYTIKLISPLRGSMYERNKYGDLEEYPVDMSSYELVDYEEQIANLITFHEEKHNESERGLAEYMDERVHAADKIISIHPRVKTALEGNDIYGRKMYELVAVTTIRVSALITMNELDNLTDYIRGQYSDGWGESFEQKDIITSDNEILNIHFWNSENFHFTIDEGEGIENIHDNKQVQNPDEMHMGM